MAIYDRRLLAYFADGGFGSGDTTLTDRIADFQNDAAQVEQQLQKYQAVLGGKQRIRERQRSKWKAEHRPVQQKYDRAFQIAQEEHMRRQVRDMAKLRPRLETMEGLPSTVSAASHEHSPKEGRGRLQFGDSRSNAASDTVSAREPVEAQLDKLIGLPINGKPGEKVFYVVRLVPDPPADHEPEETVPVSGVPSTKRPDTIECRVRQRLMIAPTTRSITLLVSEIRPEGQTNLIGSLRLGINSPLNYELLVHRLTDARGEKAETEFRLRLAKWRHDVRRPSSRSAASHRSVAGGLMTANLQVPTGRSTAKDSTSRSRMSSRISTSQKSGSQPPAELVPPPAEVVPPPAATDHSSTHDSESNKAELLEEEWFEEGEDEEEQVVDPETDPSQVEPEDEGDEYFEEEEEEEEIVYETEEEPYLAVRRN